MELPNLRDKLYHCVYHAKRDSLVGMVRVFEQMLAKDTGHVSRATATTLRTLEADMTQPVTISMLAGDALEAWNR